MSSRRRLIPAVTALVAIAALTAGCGDPDAGDAAAAEFRAFMDQHPVDGYEAVVERAENSLPFAGSLGVTIAALDPDLLGPEDYLSAMAAVAEQVCAFAPEANAEVSFGFALGDYSTPLACPGDDDSQDRLVDAAELLVEAQRVPGVESVEYLFAGTLEAVASPGVDLRQTRVRVERLALRHTLALGDEEPSVSVMGRSPSATGSPG
ncbi:hypothetical protein [Nocardioides sp. cx-173]|uniref:hypothetical protein n=1 Tax=Nocardioides sp. cx-173 TaxID=2898796 RepID=UPI001E33736F|nr:hypothetical protein [Nocardioides sp. cx-173]MCD4523359.1 hypothetical protein [Nocardioides sp. cx-173]UGB42301.1 hypothetical protein LQ940_01945 [Nocardioides sp. cx-173]